MLFQDVPLTLSAVAGVALPLVAVLLVVLCLCLRKKTEGFSNLDKSNQSANASQAHVNTSFAIDVEDTAIDAPHSTAVTIEPLPNIATKGKLPNTPLRPRIGCIDRTSQNAALKQLSTHSAFPRNQIVYLKELGAGWFGKVIESDAEKITTGAPRTKVVVKMLKDDASKDEQLLFFEEVAPFRELEHANILHLLGQCTEMHPMLMIMESASFGNLKHYLRGHRQQKAALIQKNRLMQFAVDASCGLACLHRHNYLHRDLAARNCLVMGDYTLKIGDYGIAEDLFKEDYYVCGSDLLPIRWMAPETLKQESGKWSSHNFSKESDIWSLGVVLWEIMMMGERPYDLLTDEAVMQGVMVDKDIRLPEPDIGIPNMGRMYEVMRFCWLGAGERTKVDEVCSLLQQISTITAEKGAAAPKDTIAAFEEKWEHLMPNQRHMSLDSVDDTQGSISSEDLNLLEECMSQEDSLEDLTAPKAGQLPPQAPPRSSKKRVSAGAVSIPDAEGISKPAPKPEATKTEEKPKPSRPAPEKPKASRPAPQKPKTPPSQPVPEITVSSANEANPAKPADDHLVQQKEESSKAIQSFPPSGLEVEFTDFTSHDFSDRSSGDGTLDSSQADTSGFTSGDVSLEALPAANEDSFDFSSGEDLTKVQEESDETFAMSTPKKPESKAHKTSTPVAKDELSTSPSSSSYSSSATFLTASSSLGNVTDTYTTASDSTLVIEHNKGDSSLWSDSSVFGEMTSAKESRSLSFEILDTSAVSALSKDNERVEDDSPATPVPGTFPFANQDPGSQSSPSVQTDNGFGEFTNAFEIEKIPDVQPEESVSQSANLSVSSEKDDTMGKSDFFSFSDESSTTIFDSQNDEASKAIKTSPPEGKTAMQDVTDPFVSFGTDLSSLSSQTMPAESIKSEPEPEFPSLASDFSSLGSLNTKPLSETNPFALDLSSGMSKPNDPNIPPEAAGSLSFDAFSALPDVSNNAFQFSAEEGAAQSQSKQHAPDLFGDLGSPQKPDLVEDLKPVASPPADIATFGQGLEIKPDPSSNAQQQDKQQQPLTDLFGNGGDVSQEAPSSNEDSFIVLDSQEPEPSGALSDFDLLSGFPSSPAPAPDSQSSSSKPASSDGELLQDFAGAAVAAAASPTLKVGTSLEHAGASFSGEVDSSTSGTDTDSTSNSDSSRDYICEEPLGESDLSPPGSPSEADSEEYALKVASELYLSKGLKMARPYETSVLEPIPEDPLPSVSEESGVPTPSETSSVDVRFEDVFEWDDFMGEPLVGKERTCLETESPVESFDMPDWTLDVDSESVRSGGSHHSHRSSDDLNRRSNGSDSVSSASVETPNVLSSGSENEVTMHAGRARTHRSYISDILANRTKGLTHNTSTQARTLNQSKFYSLYEEDFDFESDSQSEGSHSPPVPNPASESLSLLSQGGGGHSALHDEMPLPCTSHVEGGEGCAPTNTQDSQADIWVGNSSGAPLQSSDATLLDFTAFESASTTTATVPTSPGAVPDGKAETNGASSLIDF